MQIPFETLILIAWPIATAIIIAGLATDDLIVRDVCRREGRTYSILWPLSCHWHWRIFRLSWFKEAKEAGYFKQRTTLFIAWLCFILICIILVMGGFVSFPAPVAGKRSIGLVEAAVTI